MKIIIDIIFYVLLAALMSWSFYYIRRKELIGGFLGGLIISLLGAILGVFLLQDIINYLIEQFKNGFGVSNVNLIAGGFGGYISLVILNAINHNRVRKEF